MGKKLFCMMAAVFLLGACALCGCGSTEPSETGKPSEEVNRSEELGTFFTLNEAYEHGFLTYEDILSIAYYHNKGRRGNEEIMSETYAPQAKMPEVLEDSTEEAIKKDEADWLKTEIKIERAKASDVFIIEYNGTYNGYVVIMTTNNYTGYSQAVWTDHIAGVEIRYGDGNEMKVWRETR